LTELRRGVDPAAIFSLEVSPSSTLLAVTSDKSTLHIFDLPRSNPPGPRRAYTSRSRSRSRDVHFSSSSGGGGGGAGDPDAARKQKWGVLGRLPMMPRVFSDTYSFTKVHFEMGDEPLTWQASKSPTRSAPIPGVPGGSPPKGLIGWISDDQLVVVGAGQDARWERFSIGVTEDGRRVCYREGWKRYLE
jgi:WD repeat-containing protein 45